MNQSKFTDLKITAKGEPRGFVPFDQLETIWFNTGTLCNLSCENCYIESSPKNDRLSYITSDDVRSYINELEDYRDSLKLIAFTGGEPFLNPSMIDILDISLRFGVDVLVLTNGVNILKRVEKKLLALKDIYQDKLFLRISLDHYTEKVHEDERGIGTFNKALTSLKWLYDNGFKISIAGRSLIDEPMQDAKKGYQDLIRAHGIDVELSDENLVVFPEMASKKDVPEITTSCWDILGKTTSEQMCATQRMVVKKKGDDRAVAQACTLLAYDDQFNMGDNLADALSAPVYLNHRFCAEFCVLGGANCSSAK